MSKYKALVTTAGAAKIAAASAGGKQLKITHMAVGDGSGTLPTPNPEQTKLVNEKYRATLNTLTVDGTIDNHIIAELIIPANIGGFWLREMGLYDENGALIAVSNMAESYKPQLNEGSGRTQTLRMVLIVSSTEAIQIIAGGDTVLATRDFVDDAIKEHEKTRNHPDASTTAKGFVQLSSATTSSDETKAATPKAIKDVNDASVKKADNLSDLKDKAAARKNLALGTAATRNVGTDSGNLMEIGTAGLGVGPQHKDDTYGNIAEFFRATASSANRPGNNSYGGVRLPIDGVPTSGYVMAGADLSAWVGLSTTQSKGVTWARIYTTLFKPTASDIGLGNVGNFMAVQQGGGTGMQTNKVYIGWGTKAKLIAQVDNVPLGELFYKENPPTAKDVKAYPITGGYIQGDATAIGNLSAQDGSILINDKNGVRLFELAAALDGSVTFTSLLTGKGFSIDNNGHITTYIGSQLLESGQRVYSPNNPPPNESTFTDVSGNWISINRRSGMIMQGGIINRSGDTTNVTFPVAFPGTCSAVFVTQVAQSGASSENIIVSSRTLTGCTLIMRSGEVAASWMAIGA